MPNGDRTGPAGLGPMTGKAAGRCTGNQAPGNANTIGGGGRRVGRDRGGHGWRNVLNAIGLTGWQRAAVGSSAFGSQQAAGAEEIKKQELNILKQQAETVEQQMKQLRKQIEKYEAED